MRLLLVIAALLLAGCPTTNPDTAGTGTATPPVDNFAKVGSQIDKADQRVAAAITVAQENADKPGVVRAETGVALSFLPKPEASAIDYVRARVARNNPEEYKRAEEAGRKLLAVINANWDKAEKDAAKNKAALDAANCEIDKLRTEVAQAKKDIVTYTCAGIGGLLALAAVGLLWARQIVGAVAAGFVSTCLLAFPFLVATPWFLPAVAVLCAVVTIGAFIYLSAFRSPSKKAAPAPASNVFEKKDQNPGSKDA